LRVLAAPDKMRGTLSASDFARAITDGAHQRGASCVALPLSDGGEGFAEVFSGRHLEAHVEGPLGEVVNAPFLMDGSTAIIEMASAAGRGLLPAPKNDDPLRASTRGVGQLLLAARDAGATRIIVGCGGSATTDGGQGCVAVVQGGGGLGAIELIGATDVLTPFVGAATVFAPQKGASPEHVLALRKRLELLATQWEASTGLDLRDLPRSGAAGGLGGGLAVLGARLVSGFDLVAEEQHLEDALFSADLVITGEGQLDATTLEGKTVSSLLKRVADGQRVLVIAGRIEGSMTRQLDPFERLELTLFDLSESFGPVAARTQSAELITQVVAQAIYA
jgi:glycerate kinase